MCKDCKNCNKLHLDIPHSDKCVTPECKVKLGRFKSEYWIVQFGWYTWGGNRPVCGWYLVKDSDSTIVKPLQSTDLIDIYIIEQ